MSGLSSIVLSQPTEDEARRAFEDLGCIVCHRSGGIAKDWSDIVKEFKEVYAGKYASLDELVAKEIGPKVKERGFGDPKTWDELFTLMSTLSGKPGDPRVNIVKSYLASLLGFEKTPTPTPTPTPTAEARGIPFSLAAIIAAIIVALVVVLAYLLTRRR
ncbi:MAG: hypothetical protein QXG74_01180 [Acidilobaceae archaeon]